MEWIIDNFSLWYLSGLACSVFWPIRYRRNMKGHWCDFLIAWPIHGFFGPFAILTAFPV